MADSPPDSDEEELPDTRYYNEDGDVDVFVPEPNVEEIFIPCLSGKRANVLAFANLIDNSPLSTSE